MDPFNSIVENFQEFTQLRNIIVSNVQYNFQNIPSFAFSRFFLRPKKNCGLSGQNGSEMAAVILGTHVIARR